MPSVAEYLRGIDAYLGNRYSQDTIANARSQARIFLERAGNKPAYTRADILGYMDSLIQKGYRPRSVQVIIGTIKIMFRANKLEWPLDIRDMHLGLPKGEPDAPVVPSPAILNMIHASMKIGSPYAEIVALSTTWGLRATELTSVLNMGLDGTELVVQTAKGGEVRRHTIPPELADILSFRGHALSRDSTRRLYYRIMAACRRKPEKREGWHAIRRSLVTALIELHVAETDLYKWMGWKRGDILYRYNHADIARLDRELYAVHPFLAAYRAI